jgi:hypothetical protein
MWPILPAGLAARAARRVCRTPRVATIAPMDKWLAVIVFGVCAALMLRLVVGARLRHRIDHTAQRFWQRLRGLRHWRPPSRRSRADAERLAEEAIRRARGEEGHWEGNVYKPKSFKRPPRDKMH